MLSQVVYSPVRCGLYNIDRRACLLRSLLCIFPVRVQLLASIAWLLFRPFWRGPVLVRSSWSSLVSVMGGRPFQRFSQANGTVSEIVKGGGGGFRPVPDDFIGIYLEGQVFGDESEVDGGENRLFFFLRVLILSCGGECM